MPDQQGSVDGKRDDPFAGKAEAELEAARQAADRDVRVEHLNQAARYAALSEQQRWLGDRR